MHWSWVSAGRKPPGKAIIGTIGTTNYLYSSSIKSFYKVNINKTASRNVTRNIFVFTSMGACGGRRCVVLVVACMAAATMALLPISAGAGNVSSTVRGFPHGAVLQKVHIGAVSKAVHKNILHKKKYQPARYAFAWLRCSILWFMGLYTPIILDQQPSQISGRELKWNFHDLSWQAREMEWDNWIWVFNLFHRRRQ